MANFYAQYPSSSSSGSSANASVGPNGAPIPTSATLVAGEDPSLNLHPLQTDSSGNLLVSLAAAPFSPFIVKDLADGSVTGGTAGTFSQLQGGIFNTSLPALTNGQQAALQLDFSGRLFIAPLTNSSVVKAQLQDNAGNGLTSQASGGQRALDVGIDVAGVQVDPRQIRALTSADVVTAVQATAASLNATVVQSSGANLHVNVDNFPATQPISGTVTANQGTSPWVENVSQFGGSNVVTGTGASGAGIPRVTISNDSSLAANQSVNLAQVAGATTATGHGTAAGALRVELPTDGTGNVNASLNAGTNLVGKVGIDQTTPGTTNAVSLAQIGATTVSSGNGTAGAGAQRVTIASDNTAFNVKAAAATPAALTVTQAAITVGTSAVRLTVSGSAPSATRVVLVATPDNASTANFFIGSSSVTNSGANRGIEIVAGQTFIANSDAGDYYIIASTAAQTVYVMEQA